MHACFAKHARCVLHLCDKPARVGLSWQLRTVSSAPGARPRFSSKKQQFFRHWPVRRLSGFGHVALLPIVSSVARLVSYVTQRPLLSSSDVPAVNTLAVKGRGIAKTLWKGDRPPSFELRTCPICGLSLDAFQGQEGCWIGRPGGAGCEYINETTITSHDSESHFSGCAVGVSGKLTCRSESSCCETTAADQFSVGPSVV
jgi:hypothetical protein